MFQRLSSLQRGALLATSPQENAADLDDTNASQEEVDSGKPGTELAGMFALGIRCTYRMLRGLMIKHQRVQMAPVAIRAPFWVSESFSAGRLKSEMPAMTSAHYLKILLVMSIHEGRNQ